MPNPKRRHSQQRSAKRRTHYKAETLTLDEDKAVKQVHRRHRAYVVEDKLYYNGQLFTDKLPSKLKSKATVSSNEEA